MNEIMGSNSLLALVVDAFWNDATTQLCLAVLALFFTVWCFVLRPSYARKNIEGHTEVLKKVVLGEISEVSETTKNWFMQYFVVNALADKGESFIQLTANKKALLKVPAEDVVSLTAPYHGESSMPSLMTTIGVLGTFAGITLGIQPLDVGLSQGSEDLLKGAGILVEGMKTAFVTSLAGLLLAAASMILLSYRQKVYNNDYAKWVSELKEVAILADPFSPLMALASPERQQADKQAMLAASNMAKAAEAMQQSLSGFNADAIGEKVASSIEGVLQGNMMPVFEDMKSSLSDIQTSMKNQNEDVLEALISNLRTEVIEPLADRVSESVEVSAKVSQSVESLHQDLNGLEEAMSNTVKRIVEAGSELASQSERMLESKHQVQELLEAVGATKASMINHLNEVAKHLGGSVSGLNNQYEKLNSTIQEQMTGIMQKSEECLTEIEQRNQKLLKEHDKYTSDILNHIEETTQRIAGAAEDARDSVNALQHNS